MIIGNNKSLITAMLTMVAGIAFAQSPGHCSIYVRLKGEARAFNAMAKQHGLPSMSRKVKSAQLFNSLDTSKQGSMVKKMMSTTAYSLHVGDAMQNCYRIDLANVTDGQAALEAVKSLPEVEMAELAEPIPVMQATSTVTMPADPLLHLNEINGSWHLQQIGYDKIYGQYAASANVKVAVVDNAV